MSFAICSSPGRSDAGELGRWRKPPAPFCSFDLELACRLANAPEAELFFFRFATALDERHVEMVDQNTTIERLA
jgi:hypothetical protein